MKCHKDPQTRLDGKTKVAAVPELLDPKMVKHGPAAGHRGAITLAIPSDQDSANLTPDNPGPHPGPHADS